MTFINRALRKARRLAAGGGAAGPVSRPAADGAFAYDKVWSARLELIRQVIAEGEDRLPAALATIVRRLEKSKGQGIEPADYVCFDAQVKLPPRAAQRLFRSLVVEGVNDACSDLTTSLIELGSGWGEHLCNLWCEGGPRHATYYACELSGPGRECALTLASLEKDLRLEAPHFDYLHPEFQSIAGGQAEIVVYSVHSVEQIEDLPDDLLPRVCALAGVVKGVHLEPVGWQLLDERDMNPWTIRHRDRCSEKSYNRNFWRLLKRAEADGLIVIDRAMPNLFGLEYNPASYIAWRKAA